MRFTKITWIIVIVVFLSACDYRTPSKERFEKITKIELADSLTVLEDRFERSGPDYGLSYRVILQPSECREIKDIIQKSSNWHKSQTQWRFNERVDGVVYDITFSVEDCQINYKEDLI